MGFLEYAANLEATTFTQDDLQNAQTYLSDFLRKEDPAWLLKPHGPLAPYWKASGDQSSAYLVEFFRLVLSFRTNTTLRSTPLVVEKIRGLFRPPGERQFEERLLELQFAANLAVKASPIALDYFVDEADFDGPARPASPDFTVVLDHDKVHFEVSVMRFGAAIEWEREAQLALEELTRFLMKKRVRRTVTLRASLRFKRSSISRLSRDKLRTKLVASEEGLWSSENGLCEFEWATIPHFPTMEEFKESKLKFQECTIGRTPPSASVAIRKRVVPDAKDLEAIVRSVRSKLDGKRHQRRAEEAFFLVLKVGTEMLSAETLCRVIEGFVWKNPYYAWLTGCIVFTPRTKFGPSERGATTRVLINPIASIGVPQAFDDLMYGRRTFHTGLPAPPAG